MAVSAENRLRFRAILISREVKALFCAMPEILRLRRPRRIWRWLFLGPEGKPHRAGEIVLADLRRIGGLLRPTIVDSDPVIMAYREGRRSAVMEIINYLNLDEIAVRKLMELDDGLG